MQTIHFHKNDFALRLALKQRHNWKGTRKWPITSFREGKKSQIMLAVLSKFRSNLKIMRSFLNQLCQKLCRHNRQKPICVAPGQTTTPVSMCPTICDKCVGSLTSPVNHVTVKMHET